MGMILRNRALLTLALAEAISNIGNWITTLAVFALVVFRGGGGSVETSTIMLAALGPMLLFSPVAGALCDRWDRKWLMIASQLLAGLAVTGLIFVDSLPLIYTLLALQSVVTTVIAPARQAVVRQLVADDDLTRANALLQQLSGIIKIGGPILAGFILSLVSPHAAMALDVLSFALAALFLLRLPGLPPQPRIRPISDPTPAPTRRATQVLYDNPLLRLLFAAMFALVVVIMGFDVLSSVFTRDVLGSDEGFFGLLVGSVGLGTVAAAAVLLLRTTPRDPWRDVLAGLVLMAGIPGGLALATWLPDATSARLVTLAGCMVGGFGDGLLMIQCNTLIQRLAPPPMLGRMVGASQSVVVAGQLVAIFSTPLLVPALLSMQLYFTCATIVLMLLALLTAWTLHSVRRTQNRSALSPQIYVTEIEQQ